MPRLFWKLFLTLWLSIMAFALIATWVSEQIVSQRLAESAAETFQRDRQALIRRLEQGLQSDGEARIRRAMRQLPRRVRDHVFLFDPHGRELLGRHDAVEKLRASGQRITRQALTDSDGRQWSLIVRDWRPPRGLLSPGPRGMALRLALSALVSAIVSFFLARNLAAPLVRLRGASRSIAAGDLGARVGAPLDARRDEFGQLSRDFDRMAARLQEMQGANRRLLRDVSHELRSPLARLRVALEIARNRQPGEVGGELDRIELESERLEILVDEVLDLLRESSEARPLKLERFNLTELLQDLVEVVSYEAPQDGEAIELQAPDELEIEADRELLWRTIENLLRNALIHSKGSAISVAAGEGDEDGNIEIRVSDAGPGVPESKLQHLFDPFYRVDEARESSSGGHGLGLAIAAASVRRHGGSISARNRSGGGLEICLLMPSSGREA